MYAAPTAEAYSKKIPARIFCGPITLLGSDTLSESMGHTFSSFLPEGCSRAKSVAFVVSLFHNVILLFMSTPLNIDGMAQIVFGH
jgi:hypothetical protein